MFAAHRFHTLPAVIVSSLVFLLAPGRLTAQPKEYWPQFRGPGGLGVSADKGVPVTWGPKENLVWKTELPGAGASSPVIVGDRVFLTCFTGNAENLKRHVVCLNRGDGSIRWNKEVASKLPEQERIRENHGYASSTPVVDGERVYVFFGKSGAFAFDHEGRQLWQADVGSGLNGWGSANSPVLAGNLLIVNASIESESLVALDRKTGKEVWRAKGINDSWNAPVLVPVGGGKTELVVAIVEKILGFDPATGEQLWSCATDIRSYMVPGLVAHEGIVYCVGGRTNGALGVKAGGRGDVTRTHRVWTGRKGSNVASPVYHDGHVYWMNDSNGTAYCADAKTGNIVYEERVERADQVYASPVLVDGKIYYLARNGKTYVVAAKPKYELLATNSLEERATFNASPAVADGKLFIRSEKYLYCIGKK